MQARAASTFGTGERALGERTGPQSDARVMEAWPERATLPPM
jgi:hypothetical protein